MRTLDRWAYSPKYKWIILTATTLSQTTVSVCSQGMQSLGPYFKNSFALSSFEVGLLVTMIETGQIFTLILCGRLVDHYGERRVLVIGGIMTGVFVALTALANGLLLACTLLFLAGCFAATSVPAGSKAIMTWFAFNRRGFAMGVRQTGIPLGGVIASLTLPHLAESGGWQLAVLVAGTISVIGAIICYLAYREFQSQLDEAIPMSVVIKPPAKIDMRQLFTNRSLLLVGGFAFFFIGAQYTLTVFIAIYLNSELGLALPLAISFLAVAQASGAVGRVVWGFVSDRFFQGKRRPPLIIVGFVGIGCTLWIAELPQAASSWLIGPVVALFGFTMVGWTGMYVALTSEIVGRNQAGTAIGFSMTIIQFGKTTIPPLFGLLNDLTHSFKPGWWTLAGLILAGTLILFQIREQERAE